MKRENRYFVIKLTDAAKYLTQTQISGLQEMGEQVNEFRAADGKPPMHGVFVEHDWPEYEPTWQAIEQRMDAAPNSGA
ncbi:hypothetical protein [Thiobacillus denitrificans]|uniref:hypothetical protein n=1 Tax=Thiobacillus denitrificans TaxID=36861 RepID=UPI000360B79A|nr:hypothetical protein [Thiobacillus denitrificans]